MDAIAIVGMACRYAEARSPRQLWENVLAQRRSFRRLPRVRLNLADYSSEAHHEDRIAPIMAAVLDDYEFDSSRFHISHDAFLSTDLSHWLALDVAEQALSDANLLDATREQRERTAVYVGNSLTGEFSRANLMRLRWPYVRRVLGAALQEESPLHASKTEELIRRVEARYKAPFPATNEESLAGGLSNTIAGRICNYFDLKGGGYTVDGACASSLLAIATGCSALRSGDVEVAIAGGVDLSLDPFELAGFSSLGALAADKMRVFDAHSSGFWPGEGCGMVVLMRHEDALAQGRTSYALIRGWGISSDGHGGLTRPEVSGQMLALRRAYERSGYGIDSVAYFEGHGTGTSIGDATELQALSYARHQAPTQEEDHRAAIGSIKANIGHTKAAAGVAGVIKTAMAVHTKVLPPTTGSDDPHSALTDGRPVLRILREAELWPASLPVRAGVSGFGFGGINVHVTLEAADTSLRRIFTSIEQAQISSAQDCELFVFVAESSDKLTSRLEEILQITDDLSYAELSDLSIYLAKQAAAQAGKNNARAACIASSPDELAAGIRKLLACCASTSPQTIDLDQGTFLATAADETPRIAFLFPGQASPVYTKGGAWERRFPCLRDLYTRARLPQLESINTEIAQPCIVTASLAGLQALALFNVRGAVALGHSLGEITALYWAGACKEEDLLTLIRARGRAMAEAGIPEGGMASIRASYSDVLTRLNGDGLVIAARNAPEQTVVSGTAASVQRFTQRMNSDGFTATMLSVSHAFHSPLVAEAANAFARHLAECAFTGLHRRVISTITAAPLDPDTDLRALLREQITLPVLFADAFDMASTEADLFFEVGPGSVLSGIAADCAGKPVIALDAGSESLRGLFAAVASAFVLGAPVRLDPLFDKRFGRPIDPKTRHSFLANPCETVAEFKLPSKPLVLDPTTVASPLNAAGSALDTLMTLVARRTKLPRAVIQPGQRFLTDLHLNSITVSQIILEAASQLSLRSPIVPAEYTNTTIAEAAETLESLRSTAPQRSLELYPDGIDSWVRVLGVELLEKPLRRQAPRSPGNWTVMALEDSLLQSRLQEEFSSVSGHGIVCCVPAELNQRTAGFLLQSAQAAIKQRASQFVFVQNKGGAGALARSLHLENPGLKVTVIDAPSEHPDVAKWAAAEASTNAGFIEARYDNAGTRREPRLTLLQPEPGKISDALGADDLLLVTGGGKGIAAESAFQLARTTGCRLALLGRSNPSTDSELRQNLNRLASAGITCNYFAADITDPSATRAAVEQVEAQMGPVTAVLHGAGINNPMRLAELTLTALQQTLATKVDGLFNVVSNIHRVKLRLLVTFGSIIARTGLHGEAHYGLANEFLDLAVKSWQKEHSHCRCLNLEWSVWAGVGMGQRLGVLDSLVRQGITPIPIDAALEHLQRMLAWEAAPGSAIVTGRFGKLPTLKFEQPELPLLRFLERTRIHHPGIELIAEAELGGDSDPYIAEHAFQGEQLFPAVMGMEAMAQVAQVLEQSKLLPAFHDLRFEHPVVIPRDRTVTIRLVALRRKPGLVSVALQCSSTGFTIDHFRGDCIFGEKEVTDHASTASTCAQVPALLDGRQVYERILFHRGRFRRVEGYASLHSRKIVAKLTAPSPSPWFARHLSPELVLGDSAARDAALHSIQACIPHRTILPVGVCRIVGRSEWTYGPSVVRAVEHSHDGDDFIYDVTITNAAGQVCEQWLRLQLRAVAPIPANRPWPAPLLVPYLERKLAAIFVLSDIKIGLAVAAEERCSCASASLVQEIFGAAARLTHRPDGKPIVTGAGVPGPSISLSHSARTTLLFATGSIPGIGCDVETIVSRSPESWQSLLGAGRFALAQALADASKSSLDEAATEIWSLQESLRKAGCNFDQPIRLDSCTPDGWAIFSAGSLNAATFRGCLEDGPAPLAFAFVIRAHHETV
jgi:enediyne polyketide synthase